MKQLFVTAAREVEFQEVPTPVCPPDGILVKAIITAVSSGTEIRVYRAIPVDKEGKYLHTNYPYKLPCVNGYSMVGEVVETGAEVNNFAVGDRAFVAQPHGEYAVDLAKDAVKLPSSIADEEAVFLSLLRVTQTAIRRGNPTPGETVAIIGQGVIGQSTLALCQAFGHPSIAIDQHESRLKISRKLGADLAISPNEKDFNQRVHDFCGGRGADLVIEAASVWPAIQTSMEIARPGGKVVVVARHTDMPNFSPVNDPYLGKDVSLVSSYTADPEGQRWDYNNTMTLNLNLFEKGKLSLAPMITHHFQWKEIGEAYRRLDEGELDMVGVIIHWS